MLNLFKQFKTDETAEAKGVWRDYGEARFLIARAGNKNYTKLLGDLVEKHRVTLNAKGEAGKKLADKKSEEIMVEVTAKTLLLDWENVAGEDDQPMSYSVENAIALLSAEGMKDFRKLIASFSEEEEQYRVEKLEEARKN